MKMARILSIGGRAGLILRQAAGERKTMSLLEMKEAGMRVCFRINEDRTVELVDFSAEKALGTEEKEKDLARLEQGGCMVPRLHQILCVHLTGEGTTDVHAYKHNMGSESARFRYRNHTVEDCENGRILTIEMESEHRLHAEYRMRFFHDIPVVRVETTLRNDGTEPLGLEYVSSFYYGGLSKNGEGVYSDKTDLYVPYNSWASEAQWKRDDICDLGLSSMPIEGYNLPDTSNNRYHYENLGSWSSCEHLPMGMCVNRRTNEISYYEIEHSGSWQIELGSDVGRNLYLALMGPNDETQWWKNLQPGESFTTVPAAFGVCIGGPSEALGELTRYRRLIRRPNQDDVACNVIFNDYMNCLMGDPTEEKEKKIIDFAAELGCEYYCMDCGWYDKGPWWDRVGEWKESPERFPHGVRSVADYARARGMKMGLWLEIEVMGVACELAGKLPDDWFICTHGKRRIDNKRYLLDFRNPRVREYCTNVVDRLIGEYGVQFFKMDYNVTTGPGSDVNADSVGDAMLEHYRAFYDWIREIYRKHPDLVVEACSSGAQRMDYGILSLHSLQSTSDQTDYVTNSHIAANVVSAVTPEQAGMWVYPYRNEREHVIYNMVNGLLLRPYVSGLVWDLSEDNLQLMREGISLYKEKIRKDLPQMVPFWPLGLHSVRSEVLAFGLRNEGKAYLAVFTVTTKNAQLDLSCLKLSEFATAQVLYPKTADCDYLLKEGILTVHLPQEACARLFEIEIL